MTKQAKQEAYVKKTLNTAWRQVQDARREERELPDAHDLLNMLDD